MKNLKTIKKLLTTVSVASVIVSGEGALATSRYTTDGITNLSVGMKDIGSGHDWLGRWAPAAANTVFADGSSLYIYQPSYIIADRDNAVINGLDINGTKASLTVQENLSLGSVVNSAQAMPVKIENAKTLTLTGQGTKIPGWLGLGYGGININDNDYSALGEIDFDNKAGILTVHSHNDGNIKFGANTKALNTANATLNVKSNLAITDNSFVKVKTINIDDAKTLKFSTGDAGNELKLLETVGSSINFGATGDGKLEISTKASGGGWFFKAVPTPSIIVDSGNLGGNAAGDTGIIELTLNDKTTFSHKGGNVALIGIDNAHRAKKLTINNGTAGLIYGKNGYELEVTGKVYAKELEFNKGNFTFNSEVDTGLNGSSKFIDKTITKFNEDSKLGKVDFNNTDSTIKVAAGKKLQGTFVGHEGHNNVNGTIIFEEAGELDGTTSKIKELQTGKGIVKLSGVHEIKEIKISHTQNILQLADGFQLIGNINSYGMGYQGQGKINLDGDAKIIGNIGDNYQVGAINLANNVVNSLTIDGLSISADSINFAANGGNINLIKNDNIIINTKINVAQDKTGVIDANALANNKTLSINGRIGSINDNKALAKISLTGGGNLELSGGNVNVNEIELGDTSTIKINGNYTYKIAKTTNNPDKGIVEFNSRAELSQGTNLGSDANKLENIKWNGDHTVVIKENVELHALTITNKNPNEGSIIFNGKGRNVVNTPIGKDTSKFKNLTIGANAEVELKQGGHFASNTTLEGANSKLIIGSDYSSNKIVATVANNGAVQLNNAADINVELKKQVAPVNAIAEFEVSGANVTISEIGADAHHGLNTKAIKFTNAGVDSTLTLPTEFKLDGIDIDNVGNKNHTIVTSGQAGIAFRQTVDVANHIGNNDANLVNIILNGDEDTLEVKSANFFSTVKTGNAGRNEVIFNVAGGKTYGIGENGQKFKKVTFAENTDNNEDVYANDIVINDDKIVKFAKTADANIQLGHANGVGSKIIFQGLTDLKGNITTVKNNTGQATFNDTTIKMI